MDIQDMIGQFYSDHYRNILRIRSTNDLRVKDADSGLTDDTDKIIIPDAQPINRWVARHEYDISKLYILPAALKEWCNKYQHPYAEVCENIVKFMNGKRAVKVRMGKGTVAKLPPQTVIELSWSDTSAKGSTEQH